MTLTMNKINQFIILLTSLFAINAINACQENQKEMTPQEMLFQGLAEYDEKKGFELVQQALKEGANPDTKDNYGNTFLTSATKNGAVKIVKLLLDAGTNSNIQDNYGDTALAIAARWQQNEIIKLLLGAGTSCDIQDNYGDTALIEVVRSQNKEIVKLLLDANADTEIKNNYGTTALDIARQQNCHEIVEIIQNEQKQRKLIVQKEIGKHLPNVLADLVSEYFVFTPKETSIFAKDKKKRKTRAD